MKNFQNKARIIKASRERRGLARQALVGLTLEFGHLFASLVVIFVAWLLREGQQLQAAQQLTV